MTEHDKFELLLDLEVVKYSFLSIGYAVHLELFSRLCLLFFILWNTFVLGLLLFKLKIHQIV